MSGRMRWDRGHKSLLWKSATNTTYTRVTPQPTKPQVLFARVTQARLKRDFLRRQQG